MIDAVEQTSNIIWSDLFCIENENLSREQQIELIKKRLLPALQNQRRVGVNTTLSMITTNIEGIEVKLKGI